MFEFLEPTQLQQIAGDQKYKEGQYGKLVEMYNAQHPNWQDADILLLGVNEDRGKGKMQHDKHADFIRKQFFELFCWHNEIKIGDLGSVKTGKTLPDTYAAAQSVILECIQAKKTVLILGNSHDITLAQYGAYVKNKTKIEATCIDAKIDLSLDALHREDNFLVEMLTSDPNFVQHYNHLGFQSFFVHPVMMDTLDKLRFDCYRVGKVRSHMNEFEPVFRNSHLVSLDINCLQNHCMPSNTVSPNGFAGDEACMLAKYAGMSNTLSSFGIYNYNAHQDHYDIGAKQLAQMIWYFIDGRFHLLNEKDITRKEYYNEFNTVFADVNTVFYQNKQTNRWWMKLPDNSYIACSHQDYLQATQNEIPERWLRAQERHV
jgi:arginase family enzyme